MRPTVYRDLPPAVAEVQPPAGSPRGARPLKLHCARHTNASLARASGKSLGWVANQLGHASPALTLKTYTHAIREEEKDLSFLDFDGPKRPDTALDLDATRRNENAHPASAGERLENLEHETGLEPATPTLATSCSTN